MVSACNDPAMAISPTKQPLFCDPEVIRSTDEVTQKRYEEMSSKWRLAILEEKGRFVVSGACIRVAGESTFPSKDEIITVLKGSARVMHIHHWDITLRSDENCDRFIATSVKQINFKLLPDDSGGG